MIKQRQTKYSLNWITYWIWCINGNVFKKREKTYNIKEEKEKLKELYDKRLDFIEYPNTVHHIIVYTLNILNTMKLIIYKNKLIKLINMN